MLADSSYVGQPFAQTVKQTLGEATAVQIAKRSELHKFAVIPKRWCRFTFNVSLLHFQLALNGLPQILSFIERYLKRWYRCEQGAIKALLSF